MPTFKYVAYDISGRKKEGTIEAQNRDAAILSLKKKGMYAHSITDISSKNSKNKIRKLLDTYTGRITQKIKSDLFFQLATLTDAGIPLTQSLQIVAEQIQNKKIKNALLDVKDLVNEGTKFSKAISKYPTLFAEYYIRMIEIAEKTGKLSEILFKIAQREEEKNIFNQKIAPAILYPAFVLSLGMGIVGFLLAYVVPKMEKIFSSFHKKLPLITRMLIALGTFMKHYFLFLVLVILGLTILFKILYTKNGFFREYVDRQLLKITIYRKIAISQFTATLAFQLDADIKLTEAIVNSALVVKNIVFLDKLKKAADKINSGEAIDNAFKETELFDSMFIASVSMGSKTGKLGNFIKRVSEYYEKRLDSLIKTSISIIEPVAILILGLIVGFIVMAIMVPIFNINQLVK